MNSTAVLRADAHGKPKLNPWDLWVLALPVLAASPLLLVQWQHLMNRPERQFFPLLVAIGLYFPIRAMLDQEEHRPITRRRMWAILVVLALSFVTFGVGVWLFSPWMGHAAVLGFLAAWGLGRFPELPWTRPISWVALLGVTLPLPLGRDEQLIAWLQNGGATACGNALDALNVPHIRTANIIEIKGQQLFVEEACSGIGSLYALLAAAALLLVINRRSLLCCLLVILSVPIWAFLGNLLRLMIIALAQEYYQRDLSHGVDHELLGVLTFSFAAISLWMTDWLLAGFLRPLPPSAPEFNFAFRTINALLCWPEKDPMALIEDEDEHESSAEREYRLAIKKRSLELREARIVRLELWQQWSFRCMVKSLGLCMLVLGGLVAVVVFHDEPPRPFGFGLTEFSEVQLSRLPGKEALPEKLGSWQLVNYGREERSIASDLGAHSFIWDYRNNGQRLLFSLDFPFRGFHPLEVCYHNTGWTINELVAVEDEKSNGVVWEYREASMSNQFSSHGFLCYSLMTERCEPFGGENVWDSDSVLMERLLRPIGAPKVFTPICYQIQMFCETGRQLTDSEKDDVKQLFLKTRELLKSKIAAGL